MTALQSALYSVYGDELRKKDEEINEIVRKYKRELEERDNQIAERDNQLAEKDNRILELEKENEVLKNQK